MSWNLPLQINHLLRYFPLVKFADGTDTTVGSVLATSKVQLSLGAGTYLINTFEMAIPSIQNQGTQLTLTILSGSGTASGGIVWETVAGTTLNGGSSGTNCGNSMVSGLAFHNNGSLLVKRNGYITVPTSCVIGLQFASHSGTTSTTTILSGSFIQATLVR
jgi:hypothetical protein